jgi:hypothetical protein
MKSILLPLLIILSACGADSSPEEDDKKNSGYSNGF